MSIKNKFKKVAMVKAIALVSFASAVSAGGGNPSISLEQTVSADLTPMTCGTEALISVNLGESVNFCYTVTNDGDEDFDLHTLETSEYGQLITDFPFFLEAGESVSLTDIRTPASSVINDATWTASQSPFSVISGVDFEFVDISATGTEVVFADPDEGAENVVIPFNFNYFGSDYTDLRVGANGAALLGETIGGIGFSNTSLPTAGDRLLAPFWEDLIFIGGGLFTQTDGALGSQTFTVQWNGINRWTNPQEPSTSSVTFQLVLFEGTNEIQFRYLDTEFGGTAAPFDGGAGATIGVDSGDGVNAFEYSFNGANLVADMTTVSFQEPIGGLFSADDSSTAGVSVLTPQVEVNPSTIDTMVDSAGMGSEVLSISNSGQGSLEWSVEEASAPTKTPRPLSFYTPENDSNSSSSEADMSGTSKSAPIFADQSKGGGPIAYSFNVLFGAQNFGTFDYQNPGAYNVIADVGQTSFAGDFINDDFSTLYFIDADDNNLYTLNTADGVTTLVGGPALPTQDLVNESWTGMTEDPRSGTVYLSTTNITNSWLYTIDLTTAAVTLVGEVTNSPGLIDVASSAFGDLYGFDIVSDSLIAIDSTTGAGTVIGAVGLNANFAQGMDFDNATNTLYIAAYTGGGTNQVLQMDLTTGVGTSLGTVDSDNAEIDAFGIATPTIPCVRDEDIPWMSVGTSTGSIAAGGSEDVSVDFDATALSDGIYNANVCVFTNDPDEPLVTVPVTLQVGPDDLIYANGFEAPPAP